MQSLITHNIQKLTIANRVVAAIELILAVGLYVSLMLVNVLLYKGVYSGSILLWLFLPALICSAGTLFFAAKSAKKHPVILLGIAFACIAAQAIIFGLYRPSYTISEAARLVQEKENVVSVTENPEYTVMDMEQSPSPFVQKGYVLRMEDETGEVWTLFFNPVNGEYAEIGTF